MKSLKIILFILCGLIGSMSAVHAQENLEKIRSLQIAYLSKELDLSPDEAQKFWPVYNKYSKEVEALIVERRQKMQEVNPPTPTDKTAATQAVDRQLGYEQRMLDIKTHYKDQFMQVLPAEKVNTLYRAEREFRQQLIRQLKERQEGRPGGFKRMRQ